MNENIIHPGAEDLSFALARLQSKKRKEQKKMSCGLGGYRPDGGGGHPSAASTPNRAVKCDRKCIDERFRDYLVRTNIDVIAVVLLLACYHAQAVHAESAGGSNGDDDTSGLEESEEELFADDERAVYSVLFPWFAEIVGVFVYFFLSRYLHAIPYTAIMFIVGAFIGLSSKARNNAITFSASTWAGIEGELILLVFLPGLLFLDSYNLDIHLFTQTFAQLVIFAFPMMLAGTALTALVAYYILPFGWSFDLCMTFGSILAATDPVAVAALMNELGAPPRLKMHVSGESILNDGSAAVFYQIFSARFLYEMGIQGFGDDVGWAEGFEKFFRLAFGGACIGVAFGFGLLIVLFSLNRRLSGEDSVVQVVATITTAYLAYFTSEVLAHCSGIIAVFCCGVTVKAFGETLYNDSHLFRHFWEITEFLLNSLLFTLAGCVWAFVLEADKAINLGTFVGFLFLLFVLLNIIRFFLIFTSYPLISRIGIGTNWQEALFMSYGGLRGAVGISLALSLHSEIGHIISSGQVSDDKALQYSHDTNTVFGFVGGIAFLTLVINGPTSGPLLRRLGLVTPTECRKKVIENYRQHMAQYALNEFLALLTEKRFEDIDFSAVKAHVPFLEDTNYDKLMAAVKTHKKTSPSYLYKPPILNNIIPYLYDRVEVGTDVGQTVLEQGPRTELMKNRRLSVRNMRLSTANRYSVYNLDYDANAVFEERIIFINILRSAYYRMVEHGELKARGFIGQCLFQSLNYAEDAASRGLPLSDWNALEVVSCGWALSAERIMRNFFNLKERIKRRNVDSNLDFFVVSLKVRQILAFIGAHEWARKTFVREFSKAGEGQLTAVEKIVLRESDNQVTFANEALGKLEAVDVKVVTSLYACQILLNRAAHYLTKLKNYGLMTEREAGGFLDAIHEKISDLFKYHEIDNQMSDQRKSELLRLWKLVEIQPAEKDDTNIPASDIDEGSVME